MQKARLHFQYLSLAAKRKGNKRLSISRSLSAPPSPATCPFSLYPVHSFRISYAHPAARGARMNFVFNLLFALSRFTFFYCAL